MLALAILGRVSQAHPQAGAPLPLRPGGLAFDSAGNVFFTDAGRHLVYEVSLAGTLTIVAGTGMQGYGGDGGAASSALLNEPHGLAISSDGTIFIADTGNHRVRAIRSGTISTVAGTGSPGYGGDGGPAIAALLNRPWGLSLGPDSSLLIADSANQRVRVLRSGVLSTVAGTGAQGSAGDGGAASLAVLNDPEGVAAAPDGRFFVADTGNSRIRVISAGGVITNFAGTGQTGFGGDGGPAVQAFLFRPKGIGMDPAGELYLADSGNQRLRRIGVNGTITTLVGAGLQGSAAEGAALSGAGLDGPEAVAVSPFGRIWLCDARNATVRAVTADGRVFRAAGLVSRSTSVNAQATTSAGAPALIVVNVAGQAGPAQGAIVLSENGSALATGAVANGTASLSLPALSAGTHRLTAQYSGDALNPAASTSLTSTPLKPGVLLATADPAGMRFGESLPAFTGTLDGVASQDVGRVQVSFSTVAAASSPAATYPITATLSGPAAGNYTVELSATSGQFTISPQVSAVALLTPLPTGYEGLPLALTAIVSSSVKAKPSGSVIFLENGIVLATTNVVNGSATATLASSAAGSHSVIARYLGDGNFLPSEASAQTIAVNILPDFTVTQVSAASPTMEPGTSATFSLQVGAAPAPFTGAVTFAGSGLPTGWTARFAPSTVVPGTGSAVVTLTLTASTALWRVKSFSGLVVAVLCFPVLAWRRKQRVTQILSAATCLTVLALLAGCGDRVASTADLKPPHAASFTVTGTATNLAGRVVTHAVVISYLQP